MSNRLENIVRALPPELEDEAASLLESLIANRAPITPPTRKPRLGWVGALSHVKDRYPSGVEAAHAASTEWADEVNRNAPRL
ncbi:MAG TPA: hypothetical protein VK324_16665 [Tepidisphaeraceae bacterium]|nr:hypothetical protein [Tepidisphaeraceae bacterium]